MNRPISSLDDWRDGDFSSIAEYLTRNVQQAMKTLYDLEAATYKADKRNFWRNYIRYTEVREALKSQWETIAKLMDLCHFYGRDIVRLHENITVMRSSETIALLKEMLTRGRSIAKLAKQLSVGHDEIMQPYNRHRHQFTASISEPVQKQGLRGALQRLFQPGILWDVYIMRAKKNPKPKPTLASQVFEEFKLNIDPDGKKAMTRFERATKNTHQLLDALSAFMEAQCNECSQYLSLLRNPGASANDAEIRRFVNDWEVNKVNSMRAMKDITKVCDAILIHAMCV